MLFLPLQTVTKSEMLNEVHVCTEMKKIYLSSICRTFLATYL